LVQGLINLGTVLQVMMNPDQAVSDLQGQLGRSRCAFVLKFPGQAPQVAEKFPRNSGISLFWHSSACISGGVYPSGVFPRGGKPLSSQTANAPTSQQ